MRRIRWLGEQAFVEAQLRYRVHIGEHGRQTHALPRKLRKHVDVREASPEFLFERPEVDLTAGLVRRPSGDPTVGREHRGRTLEPPLPNCRTRSRIRVDHDHHVERFGPRRPTGRAADRSFAVEPCFRDRDPTCPTGREAPCPVEIARRYDEDTSTHRPRLKGDVCGQLLHRGRSS